LISEDRADEKTKYTGFLLYVGFTQPLGSAEFRSRYKMKRRKRRRGTGAGDDNTIITIMKKQPIGMYIYNNVK
jgi:hypothetical protein